MRKGRERGGKEGGEERRSGGRAEGRKEGGRVSRREVELSFATPEEKRSIQRSAGLVPAQGEECEGAGEGEFREIRVLPKGGRARRFLSLLRLPLALNPWWKLKTDLYALILRGNGRGESEQR